jgi:Protein of unknown function (DUF2934)
LPNATDDEIRMQAYLMWENAGRPDGATDGFWYAAKEQLIQFIEPLPDLFPRLSILCGAICL